MTARIDGGDVHVTIAEPGEPDTQNPEHPSAKGKNMSELHSEESASTPICCGGWKYDPDADGHDFRFATLDQIRRLEVDGYDLSLHPSHPDLVGV